VTTPVLGVAGWKNSGKTTLVIRLVEELTRRGWKISTVKHAHHDADVDHPGTDSFRHRQAGAHEVLLATGRRWALMHELREEPEPSLDELLRRLSPCDLVIVEGYKTGTHPKIETRRLAAKDRTPLPASANAIAIAADHPVARGALPAFGLDDIGDICDFIESVARLAKR
jgi:molybdopterin-guanine dinucleotide biosynthesis protein B